jgi:mannose-6-phosphate isomerase-like protein (cupin superfamily)
VEDVSSQAADAHDRDWKGMNMEENQVRRIVTGVDPEGRDTFVSVDFVDPQVSHVRVHPILGWDAWPVVPAPQGAQFVPDSTFPDAKSLHGVRISIVDFPPGDIVDRARAGEAQAGLDRFEDYAADGMHRTNSVDVVVVISGRVRLYAGDQSSLVLGPGDCVVQNGGLHAWVNPGDEDCRLAFVIFSAERRPGPEG